jgi:hypothetical protein
MTAKTNMKSVACNSVTRCSVARRRESSRSPLSCQILSDITVDTYMYRRRERTSAYVRCRYISDLIPVVYVVRLSVERREA